MNKGRLDQNPPSNSQQNIEKRKEKQKELVNKVEKVKEVRQPALVDVEKDASTFNLQSNLSNLKVSIHFNELLRNIEYKTRYQTWLGNMGIFN